MVRGVLTGVFWGCAIGVFGLAAASLIAGRPAVPDVASVASPAVQPVVQPPMRRYARAFQAPDGQPLFAVVLIDRGDAEGRAELAALPFPVTFAIDPAAPDARDAARIYRAAGQEIAILATGLSTAPAPEAVLQSHADTLPEAVAVMDLERQGFQGAPEFATRAVKTLEEQGRGLITWNNGPNTADQVARRDGLPAARVFRKLDAGGENAEVIRSYLDRAAFRAAQDGHVVVVGDARIETVRGLTLWAAGAGAVAIAPASAVMALRR